MEKTESYLLICENCGKNFATKRNLIRHRQEICLKENSLECYECGDEFVKKNILRKHITDVHLIHDEILMCQVCEKHFSSIYTLNRHKKIFHVKENRIEKKFECSECGDKFVKKFILRQHIKVIHMTQREVFVCEVCKKNFSRKDNLDRHLITKHLKMIQVKKKIFHVIKKFECNKCQKSFMRKDIFQRHKKFCSVIDQEYFRCPVCYKQFLHKLNFERHTHDADKENKMAKQKCPLCQQFFHTMRIVEEHLEADHNVNLIYEYFEFKSIGDFDEYMKKNTFGQCYQRTCWETKTYKARRLQCHRSGLKPAEKTDRKRFAKTVGSKKLDCVCPMYIIIKESKFNGVCSVKCQNVHVGHSINEKEQCYLSGVEEKLRIATQIEMGMPMTRIMKNYDCGTYESPGRLNAVQYGDLMNITRKFSLHTPFPTPFKDDKSNVQSFIDENEDSILFFKPTAQADTEFTTLLMDDFVLVYMDSNQKKYLQLYGSKVVAFDETYGLNPHKIILHTMLVIDVNRQGIPVAFLLSNRNDKVVMDIFLECIKRQVGVISTKTLMSDMQVSYYNSWEEKMGSIEHFMYCSWHVREAWRKNFSKVRDMNKRIVLRKQIYDIGHELDEQIFEQKLEKLLNNEDPDLDNFIQYFQSYYVPHKERWAYCYRLCVSVNTNMHLELFHRMLKEKVTGKKIMKTFYQCLRSIELYLIIQEYSIGRTKICGKLCPAQKRLRKRHRLAEQQMKEEQIMSKPISISRVSDTKWQVASFQESIDNVQEMYIIQKYTEPECTLYSNIECQLRCPACKICSHELLCSCLDSVMKNNMCKHIHLLIRAGFYHPSTNFPVGGDNTRIKDNDYGPVYNHSEDLGDGLVVVKVMV